MQTLFVNGARKLWLLCALALLTSGTAMAQDLLVKNATGYLVDFGQKLNKDKMPDGTPVAIILVDISLFENAKTKSDTAAAWEKINKDTKYFFAVAGKISSVKETSFQLVTKEVFKVDFSNKKLQVFIYGNPANTPGASITPMMYQRMCCFENCMGRSGMYETLTRCLSGKGRCRTCVDCCSPIMVLN